MLALMEALNPERTEMISEPLRRLVFDHRRGEFEIS
jgi:hypothetical protein